MNRVEKKISIIAFVALAGVSAMSCSNGNAQGTAEQVAAYDSVLCEQLVAKPGYELSPEQFAQMVDQAIILADDFNAQFQQIINQDLNEASVAQFKQLYSSRKFIMAQKIHDELFVDFASMKIPAGVQKRALEAQQKTDKMQKTFEMMYCNMSGFVGDAGTPQYYQDVEKVETAGEPSN